MQIGHIDGGLFFYMDQYKLDFLHHFFVDFLLSAVHFFTSLARDVTVE